MRNPVTETTLEKEVHHSVPPALVHHPHRELAHRVNGGIEVTLYWDAHDNSTSVEVWQPATEETLHFTVAQEQALDAFYHPFAHLPVPLEDLTPPPDP